MDKIAEEQMRAIQDKLPPGFPTPPGYNYYIGPRFILKFADPIEWDANTQYEPMIAVMYQGNSYISRTYVPAGIVPTNEEYWAPSGMYNAQIEQYRREVQELDGRITDVENQYDELEPMVSNNTVSVNALQDKTAGEILLVSDSYGVSPTPGEGWCSLVQGALVPLGYTVYAKPVAGTAFNNKSFTAQLTNADITKPSAISKIIVLGGRNDAVNTNIANVVDGIKDFITTAKQKYPNAKIYIGFVGSSPNGVDRNNMMSAIQAYINSQSNGYSYITNAHFLLCNFNELQPDDAYGHPNANGAYALANAAVSVIMGGEANYFSNALINIVLDDGISASENYSIINQVSGMRVARIRLTLQIPEGRTKKEIATFSSDMLSQIAYGFWINGYNNNNKLIAAHFATDGNVSIYPLDEAAGTTVALNADVVLPTLY